VVLAGLRSNLRYLPFFFLPVVYVFSDIAGWIVLSGQHREDYHERNSNLWVIEKLFCNCHRLSKFPVENSLKSFKK
jgi:hypothetical protein